MLIKTLRTLVCLSCSLVALSSVVAGAPWATSGANCQVHDYRSCEKLKRNDENGCAQGLYFNSGCTCDPCPLPISSSADLQQPQHRQHPQILHRNFCLQLLGLCPAGDHGYYTSSSPNPTAYERPTKLGPQLPISILVVATVSVTLFLGLVALILYLLVRYIGKFRQLFYKSKAAETPAAAGDRDVCNACNNPVAACVCVRLLRIGT